MLAAYGFMLLVVASFAVLLLLAASKPEGTAYYRWLGSRMPLDWAFARIIFGIAGVSMLGLILRNFFLAARATFAIPPPIPKRIDLALGEPIRWQGRPGRRSFGSDRAAIAGLVAIGALPLVLALSWVWLSLDFGPDARASRIVFTAVLLSVLGPMALGPFLILTLRDNRWLHELTGSVAITDRRIIWCRFDGRIVHELLPERLLDVELIEEDDGRGWISLGLRKGRLNRESYELKGLPDPRGALARLQQLVRTGVNSQS